MPLYYVGIRVRNLNRSLRFYTKVLGLKESVRGDHRPYGKGIWVGLTDPKSGAHLELNWYPPRSRYAVPFEAGEALDHIGFLLGAVGRRTLEAEYRRLRSAGARPTPITPGSSDGWQACVKDPDGNWIEIFRWPTAAERRAEARAERRRPRSRRAQRPDGARDAPAQSVLA